VLLPAASSSPQARPHDPMGPVGCPPSALERRPWHRAGAPTFR